MMAPAGGGVFPLLLTVSHVFFFIGLVLLLAWAIKHLSGERLKYWGGMCILAAVALWVIAMVASAAMGRGMGMMGATARPGIAAPRPEEDAGAKASKAAARSSAAAARSAGAASSTK